MMSTLLKTLIFVIVYVIFRMSVNRVVARWLKDGVIRQDQRPLILAGVVSLHFIIFGTAAVVLTGAAPSFIVLAIILGLAITSFPVAYLVALLIERSRHVPQ